VPRVSDRDPAQYLHSLGERVDQFQLDAGL
jgi:hypothetical protein